MFTMRLRFEPHEGKLNVTKYTTEIELGSEVGIRDLAKQTQIELMWRMPRSGIPHGGSNLINATTVVPSGKKRIDIFIDNRKLYRPYGATVETGFKQHWVSIKKHPEVAHLHAKRYKGSVFVGAGARAMENRMRPPVATTFQEFVVPNAERIMSLHIDRGIKRAGVT